ncbi:MAG: hypoxanthine phosphoribosyltransferase [Verrucomicrobiales bacterium]|nr:hypoxanthine phosphoribosyltransferase [Verrucomicrobiales bacterium]
MSSLPPDPSLYDHLDHVLVDEDSLRRRIREMGAQITRDFAGLPLTVVTILQGGAVFMADLIREIRLPLKLESISVASYHGGVESCGTVTFHQSRMPDLAGRHALILDDILDSGRTLDAILRRLREETEPLSLKTCVLLSKQLTRAVPIEADYRGFDIGDEFVVGYGLDYDGEYRNLPVVGVLKPEWIRPSP